MSKIAGEINAEMMKKAIHDSRAKLFAEIVGKTGCQQSVIDCAMQEIESLRQQLAAAMAACKVKDEAISYAIDWLYGPYSEQEKARIGCREALTAQPDDSALKEWLGEPVGIVCMDNHLPIVNFSSGETYPAINRIGIIQIQTLSNGDRLYKPKEQGK